MRIFGNRTAGSKIEILKNISVFRELSRKEILEVDELLHERAYEKDEIIFEEGDVGHGIFIVLSGMIRAKSSRKLLGGAVLEFGQGDLLGELCLFEEGPRTATAVATERTVTVALFQAEFAALLMKNKSIGVKVLMEISITMSRRARQLLLQEPGLPSV